MVYKMSATDATLGALSNRTEGEIGGGGGRRRDAGWNSDAPSSNLKGRSVFLRHGVEAGQGRPPCLMPSLSSDGID